MKSVKKELWNYIKTNYIRKGSKVILQNAVSYILLVYPERLSNSSIFNLNCKTRQFSLHLH